MADFSKDDRVAWSHGYATQFPATVKVLAEAVLASDPEAELGTVMGVANEEKTYFEVALDSGGTQVLTNEELVKVVE